MDKHLLALVTDGDSQLFIHLDRNGADKLIDSLQLIKRGLEAGDCPHDHRFSEEWGGFELSISNTLDTLGEGRAIHHLKIFGWTDEWVENHGFKRI